MKMLGTTSAAVFAALLLAAPAVATWDAGNISQYLASIASRDRLKAANPTAYEMFVLFFQHNDDGTFSGCASLLLDPREAENDDEVLCDLDHTPNASCSAAPFRGTHEVLAVPTEGKHAGKIARRAKDGVGIWARSHSNTMTARDPKTFELNEVQSEADDAVACACTELGNQGVSDGLLEPFGIVCP